MHRRPKHGNNIPLGIDNIRLQILQGLICRIKDSVRRANCEEGGKLIGHIIRNHDSVIVKILSYIDSGPYASRSETHLLPDGEYQESLFRVIESYHPDIEHIGSWHSHHCNSMTDLSPGDIRGYARSVNHPDYNCDVFVSLLVTRLTDDVLGMRCFLFRRGSEAFHELKDKQIEVVDSSYELDVILKRLEEFSRASGLETRNPRHERNEKTGLVLSKPEIDRLKTVRAADNKWFHDNFNDAKAFVSKNDQVIFWIGEKNILGSVVRVRYEHPPKRSNHEFAVIKAYLQDKPIISENIRLDETRFVQIERFMYEVQSLLNSKFGDI